MNPVRSISGRVQATILEQLAEGVVVADGEGNITFFNRAAEAIHGNLELGVPLPEYSARFGLFRVSGEPYPPEDLPLSRAVLHGDTVREAEWLVRRQDGSQVVAKGTASPVLDEEGRRTGAVLTMRDVTTEFYLRRELDIERQRLLQVFELAPAFIATLSGPDHVFEMANPAYRELVGDRKIVGRTVREVFPELENQGLFELLDEVYRTGEPYIGREVPILLNAHPGGELRKRILTFVYQPRRGSDGSIDGILAHGVDVTDQVEARDRLEELYEGVEAASRAKSEFLATVSHELRTPLNAVLGYTDLLAAGTAGPLTDEAAAFVAKIDASSRHLVYLINEILSLTRLNSGTEPVDLQPVQLEAITEELQAIGEPLASEKGLAFEVTCTPGGGTMTTDPGKIRQILIELLNNALKFTDEGGVKIDCARSAKGVTVTVEDTGIGLDPGEPDQVFEPFWQAESGTTRRHGGTGLGLTVARKRAALIGADLSVRRRAEGTTFRLLIPDRTDVGESEQ